MDSFRRATDMPTDNIFAAFKFTDNLLLYHLHCLARSMPLRMPISIHGTLYSACISATTNIVTTTSLAIPTHLPFSARGGISRHTCAHHHLPPPAAAAWWLFRGGLPHHLLPPAFRPSLPAALLPRLPATTATTCAPATPHHYAYLRHARAVPELYLSPADAGLPSYLSTT